MLLKSHPAIRFAAVALILVAVTASCDATKQGDQNADAGEAPTPVLVSEVTTGDITVKLSYVADLKPYSEVRVYAQVMDRILEFPWKNGDEINAGDKVAVIRSDGMAKGLDQATAQIRSLDVQLRQLRTDLRRSRDLLKRKVIAQQSFDQVQTTYNATKAQRAAAVAAKGQLEVMAGNALVTAPMAGVVASKLLEVGDMAAPQLPLLRILQVDKLKAELKLVEEDVTKVHQGQEVELRLDAYPGRTFLGQITRIMPFIDPMTRTNMIEVTVENPRSGEIDRLFKPGMYGRAELVLARNHDIVVVPEKAVLLSDKLLAEQVPGGPLLRRAFVIDSEDVAHERILKLGAREAALYQVIDGLEAGEMLVTRGQHGLKDGEKVEIATMAEEK